MEILAILGGSSGAVSALVPSPSPKSLEFQPGTRLAFSGRMTQINSFRDLTVWQSSTGLVDVCFDMVEAIPYPYKFTFSNQLIAAGISIPWNIAEGIVDPRRRTSITYRSL